MATQLSTKVRLVRCPRCREVLAELPNVSVYKCGGCGITLQAKNRGRDANRAESSPRELDGVVEEKEATSVAGDSTRPPSMESSPDNDVIRRREDSGGSSSSGLSSPEEKEGRSLNGNSTMPPLEKDNRADDCPSSLGVDHDNDAVVEVTQAGKDNIHGSDDACLSLPEVGHGSDDAVEVEASLKLDGSLSEDCGKYDGKSRGGSGRWSGSSSDVVIGPGEIISETEPDAPEADVHVEPIDGNDAHRTEGGQPQRVWQEGDDGDDDDDFIDDIEDLPELEDEEAISAGDSEDREVDEHVYVASQNDRSSTADRSEVSDRGVAPVTLDSHSGFVSNREQHVELGAEEQCRPTIASQTSWNESLASFYLTCPEDELGNRSARESARNFERISSIDTLASSSLANLSAELVSKYQSMNKFLPTSTYYAYDGSESSYDGTDDPTRREKVGRDGFVEQSGTERRYWARGSPNRATKSGHPGPEKSTELNEYAASRFVTRQNKHKDALRLRRTLRDPIASNKAMIPSSYRHGLLPPRPGFSYPDKILHSEADKVDRLRRVHELEDQLKQMHFPKVATARRSPDGIPTGKFNPRYDRLATEEELCSGLSHHVDAYRASRQAFSGEVAHYWNRHGCSCLHCHRQDWHYSAQLAARTVHCRNSCCAASPQYHTSSKLSLWGCETEPDDQRRDALQRLRLKDKFQSTKQHLLPVAGGAPFLSCYKCWELLQLPVDFLLFKRRCHRLRCNACCEVLKFSLLEGTHLVPYVPAVSNPPPSMADGYDHDAARPRMFGPTSRYGSCQHAEDATSCSDHFRQSFCRSSEGEVSAISASVDQEATTDSYNRRMSSGSSNEPVTYSKTKSVSREDSYNRETLSVKNSKMKSVSREDQRTNRVRSLASAGPSSQKGTSEIQEVSPLHRLMGYSSPSQVFIK